MKTTRSALWEACVSRQFGRLKYNFPMSIAPDDPRLLAVKHAVPEWHNAIVLDLGCGTGRYGSHLQQWGAMTVGLDLSREFMGDQPTHQLKSVGSVERLPFPENCFDVVVVAETIQHVHAPASALNEAARVLKDGGHLIVIDRNPWALNAIRPYAPAIIMKWIDEQRGFWMYPSNAQAKERWYSVAKMQNMASTNKTEWQWHFHYIQSHEEPNRKIHHLIPSTKPFYCLTGRKMQSVHGSLNSRYRAAS